MNSSAKSASDGNYHYFNIEQPLVKLKNHHDVIKHIVSVGSRFFTADSSGRMCIYDYAAHGKQQTSNNPENDNGSTQTSRVGSSVTGTSNSHSSKTTKNSQNEAASIKNPEIQQQKSQSSVTKLKISCVKSFHAHEAGITCMICVIDTDNNTFLMTGSFDKLVKIWSSDGKCRHMLDCSSIAQDFSNKVTAISWNTKTRTAWIACDSTQCIIYDPKANEVVTDFVAVNFDTSGGMAYATGKSQSTRFGLCTIKKTEKQKIINLAFQASSGSMVAGTSQQKLIFWRYQGTGFKSAIKCESSVESLAYCNKAPILIFNGGSDGDINKWERQACLFMYDNHTLPYFEAQGKGKTVLKQLETQGRSRHTQMTGENAVGGSKKPVTTESKNGKPGSAKPKAVKQPRGHKKNTEGENQGRTVLRLVYNEENDLLIAACEDFNIYVWGFDEEQTRAAATIYAMSNDIDQDHPSPNDPSDLNEPDLLGFHRVSGFICKYVFYGHENIITSLALIELDHHKNMLVSTGWDKKMFLWDLDKLDFIGGLSENGDYNKNCNSWIHASDAEILDVCYAPEIRQIAYASSDTFVYVRKFDVFEGDNGVRRISSPLIGVMKHDHEANVVDWLPSKMYWVTASQDETVRFWSCVSDKVEEKSDFEEAVKLKQNANKIEKQETETSENSENPEKSENQEKSENSVNPENLENKQSTEDKSDTATRTERKNSIQNENELDLKKIDIHGGGETRAIHNCVLEILCNCPVSVLTVDHQNDVILAALDNNIHIFDVEDGKLLQIKYGHAENIRCILSIPERKQYISGSWDRQVIVWPSIVKAKNFGFARPTKKLILKKKLKMHHERSKGAQSPTKTHTSRNSSATDQDKNNTDNEKTV